MDAGREPVTMGEKHWTETCREEQQKEGGVPTGCRRKLHATDDGKKTDRVGSVVLHS